MSDLLPFLPDDSSFDGNEEELHLENEFLISKLREQFGADFIKLPDDDLPSSVENNFLHSVIEFEEQYNKNLPLISVSEKLGSPYYVPARFLTDEGITNEFSRIQEIMFDHHLVLDVIYETDIRKLYSFVTEELFQHETDDMDLRGFYTHFCYEEFHPNDEEDLKAYSTDVVHDIINQRLSRDFNHLNDTVVTSSGAAINHEEAHAKIEGFYNDFSCIQLDKLIITQVEITEDTARVNFGIAYQVEMNTGEKMKIEGDGCFWFLRKHEHFWFINKLDFPGIYI